jgi:hypothetical protein
LNSYTEALVAGTVVDTAAGMVEDMVAGTVVVMEAMEEAMEA